MTADFKTYRCLEILILPLEVVNVAKLVAEPVLRDVDVGLAVLGRGPVEGLSDAPGSHLEPGGARSVSSF